jgi:hypothetical protein
MNLRLRLERTKIEAFIELDESRAPLTTQALLALLPCKGVLIHSRRSGQEVFAVLPPTTLAAENRVTAVRPGDVVIEVFPPHYRDAPPTPIVDPTRGYTHLGFVYGPDTQWQTPEGYVPVSRIGHMGRGLAGFSEACAIIRRQGGERYVLTRAE